jgi:hypothetical protein
MLAVTTPTALLFSIDLHALRTIFSVIPSLALNGNAEIIHGHFCLRRVPWYVLNPAHSNKEVRLACTSLYVMLGVSVLVSTGLLTPTRISLLDMFCTLETQISISHPTKLFPNQAVRRKVWITVSLLLCYNTPIPLLFRLDLNHHSADHGGNFRRWLPRCFLTNWTRSHGASCSPR